MLVAIDIGNTNITFGVFSGQSDQPLFTANIQTDRAITTDELAIRYANLKILWGMDGRSGREDVVISSVVPRLNYEFTHMYEKYYQVTPYFVKNSDFPLKLAYDYPAEIGADRVVNAYAGTVIWPGENLVIVDFGTATTFDIVTADCVYEGGLILPGIMTALGALEEKASKLPHIDLSIPSRLIGKNSIDGIRSGVVNGSGAMVDEIARRVAAEMNWQSYRVIATGGLGKLIRHSAYTISAIDNHLTLKGLYYFSRRRDGAA